MTSLPDRIEILKLAASLLPSDPQATACSRTADALEIAAFLEKELMTGGQLELIRDRFLWSDFTDWTALPVPAPVNGLGNLRQEIKHGILVCRSCGRKGIIQASDKPFPGELPVGIGRHNKFSPVTGVEANRLEDAGDGVMSSPSMKADPDDFAEMSAQRTNETAWLLSPFEGWKPNLLRRGWNVLWRSRVAARPS